MTCGTVHEILNKSSVNLQDIESGSVDLVVTSPPYPGIEMWDEVFAEQSESIKKNITDKYLIAWQEMHNILNNVWEEIVRVVKDGGFVCINIGDATRTIDGVFQLFSNHTKVIDYFIGHGFVCLPDIHWRKCTNSPNKFMGSGMLPAGAYITLEHEYILVFRKGSKRKFTQFEQERRQKSAYFYSERNEWFSDVWDVVGKRQNGVSGSRSRSGAYPLDIPYRLINMFSLQGDVVLDPFAGLGTTLIASIMSARNSINVEIDAILSAYMKEKVLSYKDWNDFTLSRITKQQIFVKSEQEKGKDLYWNDSMKLRVKTKQERKISLPYVKSVEFEDGKIQVEYC